MGRALLLLAALVAGASSFVYTCNEVKRMLETDDIRIPATQACVVLPDAVKFPFNDEPYTWYLYNTYVVDTATGTQYELSGIIEKPTHCVTGAGPWQIKSDDKPQFACSSAEYPYAEIMLLFTSEDPNLVPASPAPKTAKYGRGTHVFVAPEGSLLVQKNSIDEGKETTLQWYTGAGANEQEERSALMPEKFVPGTSTVIIGPVTTLVIVDDVSVELTLTSFQDDQFMSAAPGFSFSLMSSGMANNLQSSRPSILVSTAYGINDDKFAYDGISITGTVKMDENVFTKLNFKCYNTANGITTTEEFDQTSDITINEDCSSLDITYKGNLAPENIGRSNEVIYLQITSNPDPVLKPETTTGPSENAKTTRRTHPPTSTVSLPPSPTTASRLPSSTTTKAAETSTTSGAAGISLIISVVAAAVCLF